MALAILLVDGEYGMQHRDERAGLAWPGYWTLFGGGLEPHEAPQDAIRREICEELALDVPTWRFLWTVDYDDTWRGWPGRLFVFEADVTDRWRLRRLCEGQGADVFPAHRLPEPTIPVVADIIARHSALTAR